MTAKDKQKAKRSGAGTFFKEARVSLKKLEQNFLHLTQCLREKRDIRDDDLTQMSNELRALADAASKAGFAKTADLTRQWEMLLERVRGHAVVFDRKIADLFGDALEALGIWTKDPQPGAGEPADLVRVSEDIRKVTGKPVGKSSSAAEAIDIDPAYLGIYLDETQQNITHFNDDLVVLEKNPIDPSLINDLFRITHTIKGSSAMMNIPSVQAIAHAMENILVIARDNQQAFPEMFPLLFSGIDTIDNIVAALREKKEYSGDVFTLVQKLKGYTQSPSAQIRRKYDLPGMAVASPSGREILARALARRERIFRIMIALEENTPLKGMKASLVEEHLGARGTVIVMHPRPEEIQDLYHGAVTIGVLLGTAAASPEIKSIAGIAGARVISIEAIPSKDLEELVEKRSILIQSQTEHRAVEQNETGLKAKKVPASPALGSSKFMPFIRIDAQKLDTLMNLSGELVGIRAHYEGLVNQMRADVAVSKELTRVITALKSDFSTLARELSRTIGQKEDAQTKHVFRELDNVRERLERLEHIAAQNHWPAEVRHIDETTGALGKVAAYIQAAVMQTRMVPIRGVFSRFNRIVRDMAKELNKDVTLVLDGEDTELDRNLIDTIAEPLIHLVRNAIDHGIEDTHTRRDAGKPERGTITLRAFHQGNNVCVEVQDDGKGLDARVLAESAIRKKLVTEDQVAQLTEREKWNLIFLPGASTAARVTGLSGRGVGMDAVRSIIGAMNGVIDIRSEVGRGTTFTLKIPLTLAIIQCLLVAIGEAIYALPLEAVMEIMSVTPEMIHARDGHSILQVREHQVPLIDLKSVLHLRPDAKPEASTRRVIILADGERHAGVVVDRFIKETEVVIKALPHQFAHVKGICGVTILGDGVVALILDPKAILQTT